MGFAFKNHFLSFLKMVKHKCHFDKKISYTLCNPQPDKLFSTNTCIVLYNLHIYFSDISSAVLRN